MEILVDVLNQNEALFGLGYRRVYDENYETTSHNFTIGLLLLSIYIRIKKRGS